MNSIIDCIASHPASNIAIEDSGFCLSYGDLHQNVTEINKIIQLLPSRAIGLYIDNSALWIILSLAIQHTNKAIVPIPPFFSGQQIKHVIDDCGIDIIFTDRQLDNERFPQHEKLNVHQWQGRTYYAYKITKQAHQTDKLDSNISIVTYTSGSTGQPKGVCLSNKNLFDVANSIASALNPLALQRHLCLLPLSTLLENTAGVWAPFISGSTVITKPLYAIGFTSSNQLDAKTFITCLHECQPDSIILLPEMLKLLVAAAISGMPPPESLKFCAVGGAKVGRTLIEQAQQLGIPAYEGYGLSECTSVVSLNTPDNCKPGTSGKALAHAKIRISADNEIEVAGSTLHRYLNTDTSFKDSYFPTGDIGYLDDEGYLTIEGRKKNMFITSYGRQVCPDWIENLLTSHPDIAQASVYGEALPYNVCVIVPANENVTSDKLSAAVNTINTDLPDYARVHNFIVAPTPFSRENGFLNTSGQLVRKSIWSRYLSEFEQPSADANLLQIILSIKP